MYVHEKDYPRPQLVRENWINLNGTWDFAFDDEDRGERERWQEDFPKMEKILVPFAYETEKSGINCQEPHSRVWYQRSFFWQKRPGTRCILHLEGCDFYTKVWVNGRLAGSHKGAYARFSFDVTELIDQGENLLVIKAEDSFDISQPRGKQRWRRENFGCWYVQTTGIWKTLWLEEVPELYIKNLKITPLLGQYSVEIQWELAGTFPWEKSKRDSWQQPGEKEKLPSLTLQTEFQGRLISCQKILIKENRGRAVMDVFCRDEDFGEWGVMEWSPDSPNLYDLCLTLDSTLGEDKVSSYFGMREFRIDGQNILLNNRPLYQRLILDQGYWKESHLTPPSEDALQEDICKVLKLGYNGVRKHQKTEDERFLYWCDKMGLLVWSEMGAAYEFGDYGTEEFTREWMEIVRQNYSHPCIITWTPFNESWGLGQVKTDSRQQHFTEAVYHLTKSFDPYRPVVVNDGWEHTVSDIITLHDYEEEGEIFLERYSRYKEEILASQVYHCSSKSAFAQGYSYKGQPVIISEFGGIAFDGKGEGWGYGNKVADKEAFIRRFDGITTAVKSLPYVCGYCYTQVSDVQQEINGLLDEERNFKVEPEIIREINQRKVGYWRSYM